MDNVELIIELSTEIVRLRREVEAKHSTIHALKVEMAAGYVSRESDYNRVLGHLRTVYKKIGDMRAPGAGIVPCAVDAAIEDLEEIESRLPKVKP